MCIRAWRLHIRIFLLIVVDLGAFCAVGVYGGRLDLLRIWARRRGEGIRRGGGAGIPISTLARHVPHVGRKRIESLPITGGIPVGRVRIEASRSGRRVGIWTEGGMHAASAGRGRHERALQCHGQMRSGMRIGSEECEGVAGAGGLHGQQIIDTAYWLHCCWYVVSRREGPLIRRVYGKLRRTLSWRCA